MSDIFTDLYDAIAESPVHDAYVERHMIKAQPVLTVKDDETAHLITERLSPRIAGRTIIEIGGGLGLLSLHMGLIAKRVYCIEASPIWGWSFQAVLLQHKPKNVSYLFGSADEFEGQIKGDIALFCTHSGVESMRATAEKFAPVVIDIYGEMIAENPSAFDALAVKLRPFA